MSVGGGQTGVRTEVYEGVGGSRLVALIPEIIAEQWFRRWHGTNPDYLYEICHAITDRRFSGREPGMQRVMFD